MPHNAPYRYEGPYRTDPLAGLSYEELVRLGVVGPPPTVPPTTGEILGQNQPGGIPGGPGVVSGIANTEFVPPVPVMGALHERSKPSTATTPTPIPAPTEAKRKAEATGPAGPSEMDKSVNAPDFMGEGGESIWQNPEFWLAAATAAGPVLGSLIQPRRFGPAPSGGAPVAGNAPQGQIQGLMGGPVPIDPRTMRPFG
ncbi:hypothetical protein LCGC14_0467120 [marine sediment metagenome]|uniref:Uncharacterized protein n=1 Tax=marine sediment metagenome TaxID=412755 RepID=A0A0F9SIJ0_9ZZZZ